MTDVKNIDGNLYPAPHAGWGGFAEELFHHTSRYYKTAEAFVRSLAADDAFSMSGYSASSLEPVQREFMAAALSCAPTASSAQAVISIVSSVLRGESHIDPAVVERLEGCIEDLHPADTAIPRTHFESTGLEDVGPLDPFMSLADRLLMPVAVRDHHVEVSLRELAGHLQSPNSTLRTNLHNAIIALHNSGFVLRNHPHLTHNEANTISDEGEG
jgi:hypothetical protein